MKNDIMINAESLDQALAQAVERFDAPLEALEYEEVKLEEDGELLQLGHLDHEEDKSVSVRVTVKTDYLAEKSCKLLQDLLKQMQFETGVTSENSEHIINLTLESSDDNSLLIGRNGETLESLEYLVNRMLSRGGLIPPPVIVDIENYRQKRMKYLEDLAFKKATRAAKSKSEVKMLPMKSSERKIMHALLANFKGVTTFSMGQDHDRHIVVAPDGNEPDPAQFVDISRDRKRGGRNRNNNNNRNRNRNNQGGQNRNSKNNRNRRNTSSSGEVNGNSINYTPAQEGNWENRRPYNSLDDRVQKPPQSPPKD